MSAATSTTGEFVNPVVQELTQAGVMEPNRLFQSPFTDLHAQGPLGVFPPATAAAMVEVPADIKLRAVG
jgi:type I restriction enzyme R subunit